MLASLKHHMANIWDHEHAFKRGGGHKIVFLEDEMKAAETLYANTASDTNLSAEQHYEQSWATSLVSCALARLATEFEDGPKARVFAELKPFLCGGVGLPSQQDIAHRLKIPINTLRSHLSRLRVRYCELLRQEIARTIGTADDIDEELRHYRQIVSNTGLQAAGIQRFSGPHGGEHCA
jgi:RNA polymerase sigma-70 factor (ECF subfamily)